MKIKNFNQYNNLLVENILDDDDYDENENKWEVKVNGETESYWEYKHDAIDQILEIIDTQGDENGLDGYEDPEDEYELSKSEICDILFDMDESDFYDKLEELKDYSGYDGDIRLLNIADEDEIEFLEED